MGETAAHDYGESLKALGIVKRRTAARERLCRPPRLDCLPDLCLVQIFRSVFPALERLSGSRLNKIGEESSPLLDRSEICLLSSRTEPFDCRRVDRNGRVVDSRDVHTSFRLSVELSRTQRHDRRSVQFSHYHDRRGRCSRFLMLSGLICDVKSVSMSLSQWKIILLTSSSFAVQSGS